VQCATGPINPCCSFFFCRGYPVLL
jgi:hypothetical protein